MLRADAALPGIGSDAGGRRGLVTGRRAAPKTPDIIAKVELCTVRAYA